MAETAVQEAGTERGGFVIDDLSKAEWAMKKIAHIQAKKNELEQQAEKMKADIEIMKADVDNWLVSETAGYDDDLEYFKGALTPFLLSQIAGTKKRSINLPSGKIGIRAGAVQYYVGKEKADKDNRELIEFAKQSVPEFVKIKETLDWASFKKTLILLDDGGVVTKDGEVVAGMKGVKGEDKIYAEVKK